MNKLICEDGSNIHGCHDPSRVESAVHSAFYPGSPPYAVGGIVEISAVLAFYIIKNHMFTDGNKRTAVLASLTLLNLNGLDLDYPASGERNFAEVIESSAASKITRDDLLDWYMKHNISLKSA